MASKRSNTQGAFARTPADPILTLHATSSVDGVARKEKALAKTRAFREPPIGVEPTTCSLRMSCSTN